MRGATNKIVMQYVLLATMGSFNFGYSIAALNTSKAFISLDFRWCPGPNGTATRDCLADKNYCAFMNVGVFIGAAVGCLLGGRVVTIGRRAAMMVMHAVFILGSIMSSAAEGFASILLARIVVGLALGLSTVCVPMLISEIATKETRGFYGSLHQLLITVGIFVSVLMGIAFGQPAPAANPVTITTFQKGWWRFMMGAPLLISVPSLLAFLLWLRRDTPHASLMAGDRDGAESLLKQIYEREDVEEELEHMDGCIREAERLRGEQLTLFSAMRQADYRRVILVGCTLSAFQQLSGVNVMMANSNKLYEASGLAAYSTYISIAMTALNVLMTFPPILLMDKTGRKVILLCGLTGQTLSFLVAFIVTMIDYTSTTCQYIAVACTFTFIISFSCGYGPILWVYLHEIFPLEIKESAASTASSLNWICTIGTVLASEYLLEDDPRAMYGIFTVFCAIGLVFIVLFVKETKGRSIDNSPYFKRQVQQKENPHAQSQIGKLNSNALKSKDTVGSPGNTVPSNTNRESIAALQSVELPESYILQNQPTVP